MAIPRAGGGSVKIVATPAEEVAPMVSADGKMAGLPEQRDRTSRDLRSWTRRPRRPRAGVESRRGEPLWDPKGDILYYVESDGDRLRLIAAALRTYADARSDRSDGGVFGLAIERSENHANYDIHPDGSRFVIPEADARGTSWQCSTG